MHFFVSLATFILVKGSSQNNEPAQHTPAQRLHGLPPANNHYSCRKPFLVDRQMKQFQALPTELQSKHPHKTVFSDKDSELNDTEEKNYLCKLCIKPITSAAEGVETPCGHHFHLRGLVDSIDTLGNMKCPYCMAIVSNIFVKEIHDRWEAHRYENEGEYTRKQTEAILIQFLEQITAEREDSEEDTQAVVQKKKLFREMFLAYAKDPTINPNNFLSQLSSTQHKEIGKIAEKEFLCVLMEKAQAWHLQNILNKVSARRIYEAFKHYKAEGDIKELMSHIDNVSLAMCLTKLDLANFSRSEIIAIAGPIQEHMLKMTECEFLKYSLLLKKNYMARVFGRFSDNTLYALARKHKEIFFGFFDIKKDRSFGGFGFMGEIRKEVIEKLIVEDNESFYRYLNQFVSCNGFKEICMRIGEQAKEILVQNMKNRRFKLCD